MSDNNGSIKEEVVEGTFNILKQWWVWLIVIVTAGIWTGKLNMTLINAISDKAVEIIKAIKGG